MSKIRALTGMLGVIVFMTLVSSARADVVHADMYLEKLIFAEGHNQPFLIFKVRKPVISTQDILKTTMVSISDLA
jgi:hypothetical protein